MAMQAMSTLFAGWAGTAVPPLAIAPRLIIPSDWPPHLHMSTLDWAPHVVRVSFYLGRLRVLTLCELEVARWANAGHSNAAIASLRQTSTHTVARQMASVLSKLGLGSRLGLVTIAELNAWAPPRPKMPANENDVGDSWLKADAFRVEPQEVARIWREVASGQWSPLASADIGAVSYVAIRRVSDKSPDWAHLSTRERDAVELAAGGVAQKVIAMKLGLAPSTASSVLAEARRHMGFTTCAQLLRAYRAAQPVMDERTSSPSAPAPAPELRPMARSSSCNK
jgi:DNA-binding CsgD family transcriptional regulator